MDTYNPLFVGLYPIWNALSPPFSSSVHFFSPNDTWQVGSANNMQCQKPRFLVKKEGLIYSDWYIQVDILRLIYSKICRFIDWDNFSNPWFQPHLQKKPPSLSLGDLPSDWARGALAGGGCCYPNLGHHGGTRANEGFAWRWRCTNRGQQDRAKGSHLAAENYLEIAVQQMVLM